MVNNEKTEKLKTFKRIALYLMIILLVLMWILRSFEFHQLSNIPYALAAIAGINVVVLNILIKKRT
ncbi:hypothetical protein [Aquibacillus saliphilus]|uniref:hypothetical protein n=1 Tax=Aquibacillus saliphilus TaxID=1909422 RepID=UPI001CF0455D|nr:hypothetical protein [Aquibacillus saliphilus]